MHELITYYLAQTTECTLPGIGSFVLESHASEADIINKHINPPGKKWTFLNKAEKISEELIKYVSIKENLDAAAARNQILEWCDDIKNRLFNHETITFETIGYLALSPNGQVQFVDSEKLAFYEKVIAERAIHKEDEHAVLVGDKEATFSEMNQYLQDEDQYKKSTWKIMALILLALALILLAIHFYYNPLSLSSLGNQNNTTPTTPSATYTTQP